MWAWERMKEKGWERDVDMGNGRGWHKDVGKEKRRRDMGVGSGEEEGYAHGIGGEEEIGLWKMVERGYGKWGEGRHKDVGKRGEREMGLWEIGKREGYGCKKREAKRYGHGKREECGYGKWGKGSIGIWKKRVKKVNER